MSLIGNHAVFLVADAVDELREVGGLWLKRSDKGEDYLLCKSAEADGYFLHLEFNDDVVPGAMHLKIPLHYVKAILFGEDLRKIGFIGD